MDVLESRADKKGNGRFKKNKIRKFIPKTDRKSNIEHEQVSDRLSEGISIAEGKFLAKQLR